MHDLDQQLHVEVDIHETQQYQEDPTTPATSRLSCPTAPTLEQHQQQHQTQHLQQPQTQQLAHQLERRAAAVLLLPWMVRRIAPVAVILHAGPDGELLRACGLRQNDTYGRPHPEQLTPLRVHLHLQTGPASTSPRHYELSAAVGTTFA